jgi:hypothetical protein
VWQLAKELRLFAHVVWLWTFVAYNKIKISKVPRRFVNGELSWHVHKKSKRNQNEDGDNRRSLWQREWNHLLATVLCRIMFVLSGNCCCMHYCHQTSYTKFVWAELIMTMSSKVWKSSLVITISICFQVWRGKRWVISFYMWVPLFDTIFTMIFWSISWVVVCSLLHKQCNKWISKSSIVWPHWHCERCSTMRCGIWRWIWNVVKKWVEYKWNEGVLGRVNN